MAENMEQQMRAMEHPPSPGKDAPFKTPGKSKNVKRESQGTASPFLKSTPKAPVVLPKNNQGVTTVQYAEEGHIDKCTAPNGDYIPIGLCFGEFFLCMNLNIKADRFKNKNNEVCNRSSFLQENDDGTMILSAQMTGVHKIVFRSAATSTLRECLVIDLAVSFKLVKRFMSWFLTNGGKKVKDQVMASITAILTQRAAGQRAENETGKINNLFTLMWIGNFADVFNFGATTKAKIVKATTNGTIFEFPSEFPCLDKNGYLAPELKTLLIHMNNEVLTLDHDHIVTRNTVLAEQEKNAAQFEKVDAELKVVKDQNAMLIDKVDKVEAHLHLKADQGELARLNAVVDDMTDANGDRDDKVRRIEKVTGVIQGVLTRVWQRVVGNEYKTSDLEEKTKDLEDKTNDLKDKMVETRSELIEKLRIVKKDTNKRINIAERKASDMEMMIDAGAGMVASLEANVAELTERTVDMAA